MKGEMEEKEVISAKEYERRQFETLVRLVPVVLCVTALVVVLKTHQSTSYGTLDYSNAGGFRYLAYANGICAGISLISAFSSAVCWSCNYNLFRAWVVFLLDQILTCMMLAAGAVATELVYLAKEGDEKGKGVHLVLFQPRIMAYKITKGLAELFLLLLFPS